MTLLRFLSVLAAALLIALPAKAASLSSSDSDYLTSAMQVQLGRYALATLVEKSGSGAAKTLAHSIATQSSTSLRQLDSLAKKFGVTPPKTPDSRSMYHYSELSSMQGTSLNQGFAQDLKIDDEMVSDTDQTEMQQGQSADLKTFAKQRHEELQQELSQLQHLSSS